MPSIPSTSSHREAALPSAKPGLTYFPALDGLRALCVAAIILYHADLPELPGGFLGVEVFFVLSGFLITSLLVREQAATGSIDLLEFWKRRARRLLPALWALLGAVSLYAALYLPGEIWRLRYEVLAGLTYVSNWYFSFAHYSYFEAVGRPSLLRHLWSLAIEEQFYLVWPLLFLAASRRWSARALGVGCLVLTCASAAWMAARFVPNQDPSALYYDSAARASAMLLGAALACLGAGRIERIPVALVNGLGLLGLVGLGAACSSLSEAEPWVFRGGLIAIDLCALAVITAAVHPRGGFLQRGLALAPLPLMGTRSYGLYLWHWPVFALTRPGIDVQLHAAQALLLRLALSVLLAELSYRFIEEPVRSGRWLTALQTVWKEAKMRGAPWLRRATASAVLCGTLLGFTFVTQAFVRALPPAERSFAAPSAQAEELTTGPMASATLPASTHAPLPPTAVAHAQQAEGASAAPYVLVLGDSVVLGAARYLRAGHEAEVELDSEVGRTASTALPHLRKLAKTKKLRPVMIIHLGNNGWLYEEQVHEIMGLLADVERVVFINAHVPKRWQDRNNATLAKALAQHPRAILIDWCKASEEHRSWFGSDGLHLTHTGAEAFAALIRPYYSRGP